MKFNNRNVFISKSAQIGVNVRIGDNVTIYDNVIIGDNSTICNDVMLGEPSGNYYNSPETYENPILSFGKNSFIRSHCIFYCGSEFGEGLITGHGAIVREGAIFGKHCLISSQVDVQGNCKIGDYSRLYSSCHIGEKTIIGKYVFIFPYTVFTNDPLPPSNTLIGATVGDFSIITVHCSILPGVNIGTNCLIGANSVVSRDVEDFALAVGSPAKKITDVRELSSKENPLIKHYPWANRFSRGFPWQDKGFEDWAADSQNLINL